MKTVIVYSAMHTGTWFLVNLLRSCSQNWFILNDDIAFEKGRYASLEHIQSKSIKSNWVDEFITPFVEGTPDLCIVVLHHFHYNCSLIKSLNRCSVRDTYFVSPMRDPFLSVHSLIWRQLQSQEAFLKESKNDRITRVSTHTRVIEELLSLPKKNLHTFKVDCSESQREDLAKSLLSFCDIPYTDSTKQFVNEWPKCNESKDCYIMKNDSDFFKDIKKSYLSSDSSKAKDLLNEEWEFLNRDIFLKELLNDSGYDKLPWF